MSTQLLAPARQSRRDPPTTLRPAPRAPAPDAKRVRSRRRDPVPSRRGGRRTRRRRACPPTTRASRRGGTSAMSASIRETTRESWGWGAVERLMQDVRYGWRTLKGTPVVTAVAILSLALGIGANTAIFSVLDTLLLRSLPVEAPGSSSCSAMRAGRRTDLDESDLGADSRSPRTLVRWRVRGVEHALQSGRARRERVRRRPVGQRERCSTCSVCRRCSAGRSRPDDDRPGRRAGRAGRGHQLRLLAAPLRRRGGRRSADR